MKKVAEARKARTEEGHEYPLRRLWYGFKLIIEINKFDEELTGASPSVGYAPPKKIPKPKKKKQPVSLVV